MTITTGANHQSRRRLISPCRIRRICRSLVVSLTLLWIAMTSLVVRDQHDSIARITNNNSEGHGNGNDNGHPFLLSPEERKKRRKMNTATRGDSVSGGIGTSASTPEPMVIIHAGPHKTGSTTLQVFLERNDTLLALRADNYDLPQQENQKTNAIFWKMAHCHIIGYKSGGGGLPQDRCEDSINMPHYRSVVNETFHRGRNLIIVTEDLDRENIDFEAFRQFLGPYQKIRFVITYRRLHHWLPSWYSEIIFLYKQDYARGVKELPSVAEWTEKAYPHFHETHAVTLWDRLRSLKQNGSLSLYPQAEYHMMNMHDGDILENFFCHAVVGATETCKLAQKEKEHFEKQNKGKLEEMDMMRVLLRASHWKDTKFKIKSYPTLCLLSKRMTGKMVELNVTWGEMPRNCTNADLLEQMYETTLKFERKHLREWFEREGGEVGLREDFDKAASTKLCFVDEVRLYEQGVWKRWFRKIHNNG